MGGSVVLDSVIPGGWQGFDARYLFFYNAGF